MSLDFPIMGGLRIFLATSNMEVAECLGVSMVHLIWKTKSYVSSLQVKLREREIVHNCSHFELSKHLSLLCMMYIYTSIN